jgi:hypothetical protein
MGYALCFGTCFGCNRTFGFNPVRVPSIRDAHGVKQPICQECITIVNKKRKELKCDPFPVHPDAYEACDERELGD